MPEVAPTLGGAEGGSDRERPLHPPPDSGGGERVPCKSHGTYEDTHIVAGGHI